MLRLLRRLYGSRAANPLFFRGFLVILAAKKSILE